MTTSSEPLLLPRIARLALATLPLSAAILRRGPPALLTLSKAVLRPLLAGIWPQPLPFGRTVRSINAEGAAADSSGSDRLLLTSLSQLAVMLWPLLLYALLRRIKPCGPERQVADHDQDQDHPSGRPVRPQHQRRANDGEKPQPPRQEGFPFTGDAAGQRVQSSGATGSGGLRIVLLRVLRAAAVAHCLVAVAALSCGALVIDVPGCLLIHTAVQWHSLLLLQAVLVAAMALMRPNKESTAPDLSAAVHLLLGIGSAWLALRLALTAAALAFDAVKPGWDILSKIMQLSPPAAVTDGDGPLGALLQPLLPPGYGPGADLRVAATGGILAVALHWVVLRAVLAAAQWGLLSTSSPKFQKIRLAQTVSSLLRGGLLAFSAASATAAASAVAAAAPGSTARLQSPGAVATPDDADNCVTVAGAVSEPVARAVQLLAVMEPPVLRLTAGRGGGGEDGDEDGAAAREAGGGDDGVAATSRPNGRGSLRSSAQLHLYIGHVVDADEAAAAAVDAGGGGLAACNGFAISGIAAATDKVAKVLATAEVATWSSSSPPQPRRPQLSVDVRVVVKQHGSVVAEVERLTVGYPRGASVSLDLSGLREGDAVLVVLPCRRPPRQEEQSQAANTFSPLGEAVPHVAPLYLPIAVVPPVVAEELCGLMDKMEREFAERTGTQQHQQHQQHPTDPRVTRARASKHHFSALVADIVSLLQGCERLGAEGAEGETAHSGGAAADAMVAGDVEVHRQLCEAVLTFLCDMRLTAAVRYVLQEIHAAGGPALLCELLSDTTRELLSQLLRERPTGGEEEEEHPGPEEEEAQPRGAGADGEMAAEGSGHNRNGGRNEDQGESAAEGEDAGGGKMGIGSGGDSGVVSGGEDRAGRLERFLRWGATPRHQRWITAMRLILLGFSEPDMEDACTAFRCHHAQPWDLAVAVLNAALAAVLVAVTIGAGYGGGGGEAVSWGPRGGGGGFLSRILPPLPPWALVQLALCCGCLLLPPLLLEFWRNGMCKHRLREPFLRASHAVSLVLLFAYVKWNGGPGEKMQLLRTGSALAALMVVTQPMSHSIHVRGSVGNWVVAAVVLALLFRAVADGDAVTVASAGTAPSSLSNNWTAWLPSAVAAASLVLASVLLVAVRDVGWRMEFLEHGGREAEEHGESARRQWRELKGGEEEEKGPGLP
ncbi:hypothetical protein PLESTB_000862300 [Pleodorina starrii]|uniref:Uncharacterized protein n=1 Tax=Pleodorina starrii TaxID=330485 RepID=A0A9W6BMD0_9CHLO|nr:hypothetical protein PLESTM_001431800 [Pleodorina starrii]GLC54425.1 hypothetical protein PLESTB_000862300 [Pleodorina starrii]GLC72078.1 hypothetical protein PLESTF_001201600 [Pleodorina starrii]